MLWHEETAIFFAWIYDFCSVFGRKKMKITKSIDFLGYFVIDGFKKLIKMVVIRDIGKLFETRNYFVSS